MRLYLEYCVQFWATQYNRDLDILKRVLQRATKIFKRLKHLSCKERLRGLGLEKRRLREGLINVYKYLKGGWQRRGTQALFSGART